MWKSLFAWVVYEPEAHYAAEPTGTLEQGLPKVFRVVALLGQALFSFNIKVGASRGLRLGIEFIEERGGYTLHYLRLLGGQVLATLRAWLCDRTYPLLSPARGYSPRSASLLLERPLFRPPESQE